MTQQRAPASRIFADEVEHHCQVWLRRLPPLYRATRGPSIRATAQRFYKEGLIDSVDDMDTGIDERGSWHALQMYHRQVTPDVWADDLARLCYQWKPVTAMCVEGGSIWNSVEPVLKAFCRARGIMPNFKKYTRTKKKEETALALQGLLSDRPMFIPRGREWANELLSQCLAFPLAGGRGHDDIVDSLANAANQIPLMTPKIKPLDEVVLPSLPNGCIRFWDPIMDDPNGQGILLGPVQDRFTSPDAPTPRSLSVWRRPRSPNRNPRI
jgi:predicted phage terminase large subunit-like protein